MSTLSWNLSTPPAQEPDAWLLLVDGNPVINLRRLVPYTGTGSYSVDLTTLALQDDGAAHDYSVALVGQGVIGPQSAPVSITLPEVAVAVTKGQTQAPAIAWPAADTLTAT